MIGPFTILDIALIALALLSGLLAMYRGITRELLSLLSWVAAGGAAAYFWLYQKKLAEEMAQQMGLANQVIVAQAIIAFFVFLIVLIVVHLVTAKISDTILDSQVGMIDRVLGFVFGMARGFVLIVIPFMFYEHFFPDPQQQTGWVRESRSLPYIKSTGNAVKTVILRYLPSTLPTTPGEQQGRNDNSAQPTLALVSGPGYHISVTHRSGLAGTGSARL